MKTLILDCTLRDGGYCNNWSFGTNNIGKIVNKLVNSGIEIIECGFLTNKKVDDTENSTKFNYLHQLEPFLPQLKSNQKFVVMINYGEYDLTDIPNANETSIDGIRVAFHKHDLCKTIEFCQKIKELGYLVFVQPMVTMRYSQREFTELVRKVNKLNPYAFYIVDSFGTMRSGDIKCYLNIADNELNGNILIGFHSHNNFQLAFSNAIFMLEKTKKHDLVIDTSVYGMGRGAGNLNSELFLNELNYSYNAKYNVKPILQIMDEILHKFYEEAPWGYSLPNYLSAVYMIHPSYAFYLCNKNSLTLEAIDNIFMSMDSEKSKEFDESYIEELYLNYMTEGRINDGHIEDLKGVLVNNKVLLIAPGYSAMAKKEKINEFIQKECPIVISINHEYGEKFTDFIFVSNERRFKLLDKGIVRKLLISSNIHNTESYAKFDYFTLINSSKYTKDNAGLMAIQLLINMGCKEAYLAGFDGYNYRGNNYESEEMTLVMNDEQVNHLNMGMKMVIDDMRKRIKLNFVTVSRFD